MVRTQEGPKMQTWAHDYRDVSKVTLETSAKWSYMNPLPNLQSFHGSCDTARFFISYVWSHSYQ